MDGGKKREENSQKFNLRRIKSISGAERFLEGLSQGKNYSYGDRI